MKKILIIMVMTLLGLTSCQPEPSLGPQPVIENVTITPSVPKAKEPTTITADITAEGVLVVAVIEYTVNGNKVAPITMTRSGNKFKAEVPGYDSQTEVIFSIVASTEQGNRTTSDKYSYKHVLN